MFREKIVPSNAPTVVPRMPMLAPVIMKIRIILPRVAPMVRMMAMSLPLSLTSIIIEEMTLKAATMMIMVKIMNMTLRSTCNALKKLPFMSRQS